MPFTPRSLPAKSLPVPAAASPALQGAIAQPLDGAIASALVCPTTLAEWKERLALYDASSWERLAQLRQQFPVTVTPTEIAGVKVYELTPTVIALDNQQRLLLHFHGGGYALAGGELCIGEGILAAHHCQIRVLSVDYRQAPDHPFPAPLEDVVAVWQGVISHYSPARCGVLGTSAGGGLLLAMLLKLRELDLPFPAAIAPFTPWADLTKTSDSLAVNALVDRTAICYEGLIAGMATLYANGESLSHPLISPLYGDFHGFPPALLVSGTRDLFLSDTVRVQRQLRQGGSIAELQLFEGLSHAEYLYEFTTPESIAVFRELREFLGRYLQP